MPDNSEPTAETARKEFAVIEDLLLVPSRDIGLPGRRLWKSGCIPVVPAGLPDLVPVNPHPESGETGFCRVIDGRLLVTVRNQGTGNAPASTTRITFGDGTVKEERTPPIEAGQSVHLFFDKPTASIDLGFTISVNARTDDGLVESDPNNNDAPGLCRAGGLPDLVVVKPEGSDLLPCKLVNGGQLLVTINNQGSGRAAASTTKIIFDNGTTTEQPTLPLEAGQSVHLLFDRPTAANFLFTVTANAKSEDGVIESDHENNVATGECTGVE